MDELRKKLAARIPQNTPLKTDHEADHPKNSERKSSSVSNISNIIEEKITIPNHPEKTRKYIKGRFLGKGGFAKCYEITCEENNRVFAAKILCRSSFTTERQKQKLITEIKIHKSLHHPHIVAFEHHFRDDVNEYILLEECENQTLSELQRRRKILTEIEVQCYIIQLVKALQYLHSHRIIHRDLKLGNLFLNEKMELKVGDFGLATKLDYEGERKKTVCGTPNYIAPEVISGTGHSYEVDIWAVGIIIYTLLIGKPPFETRDVKTTYQRIKDTKYTFPEKAKISVYAKNLIKKLLVKSPKKRLTLTEILIDDFFNQGTAIPKLLPTVTLACPPTLDYIKKFMPNVGEDGICHIKDSERASLKRSNSGEIKTVDNNYEDEHSSKNMPMLNNPFYVKTDVWVISWVDYSNKYGLGYLLNNGFFGVYFNDSSKMLLNPFSNYFSYIERKITEKNELLYSFRMNEYPAELEKKIVIFNHFKNYIIAEKNKKDGKTKKDNKKDERLKKNDIKKKITKRNEEKTEDNTNSIKSMELKDKDEMNFIFVKKWVKTKHAIIFRFSNKIVQVCFHDRTEVILNPVKQTVNYCNKNGERENYPLKNALDSSNFEMNKRVQYTKNILSHMLNINKQQKESKEKEEEKKQETKCS